MELIAGRNDGHSRVSAVSLESEVLQYSSSGWSVVAFAARAPATEGENEDCFLIFELGPEHCVVAVADGVGGMKHGEIASRLAITTLHQRLENLRRPNLEESRACILSAMEEAHNRIRSEVAGSASTIAVAELCADTVRSYHVGDSTVLICGNRGKLVYKTIDHSPTGYAVEAGFIENQESLHHAERHVLSNALGLDELRFDVSLPQDLHLRDTVVVATDGLFDNVYDEEIIDTVRKGPIDRALRRIVALSSDRMLNSAENVPSKPDDRAIILARRQRLKSG